MKLTIIGSTGGSGRQLVAQALARGHEVTAFARNPDKIKIDHPAFRVVKGDVRDSAEVESAVEGQDAVMFSLGAPVRSKEKLRGHGTKTVIDAMVKQGVNRLVSLSALGCGDSEPLLPLKYKYLITPLALRGVYDDHELQEAHIRESGL